MTGVQTCALPIYGGGQAAAVNLDFCTLHQPIGVPQLGNLADKHYYRLRRLRLLNSSPVALEEIFFDTRHNDKLLVNDLGEALYFFYQNQLHFWIANAVDRLSISSVPAWSPNLFGLAVDAPCGYIERESWSGAAVREEFSRTWFDPSLCQYVSRIK